MIPYLPRAAWHHLTQHPLSPRQWSLADTSTSEQKPPLIYGRTSKRSVTKFHYRLASFGPTTLPDHIVIPFPPPLFGIDKAVLTRRLGIWMTMDLEDNTGVLSDLIMEVFPTGVVLLIGSAMNLTSYFMISLAIMGRTGPPGIWFMYFHICVAPNPQNFSNTEALVMCIKNFLESQEIIIGFPNGFLGLSGVALTQIYLAIYVSLLPYGHHRYGETIICSHAAHIVSATVKGGFSFSEQSQKSYNNHPIWILPSTKENGRAHNALLAFGQLATIDSQNGHLSSRLSSYILNIKVIIMLYGSGGSKNWLRKGINVPGKALLQDLPFSSTMMSFLLVVKTMGFYEEHLYQLKRTS
ncbi:hypothetical protein Cgig2_013396 [Carnegiea gigantea]|uniref:Nodulin-like domain-containing protein n=1 Tax=Carnegiea gigantea TaxID=171969 RepID=A0A9Q1KD31_9CARY|nr:hypothetical protein Cgig2_013396 [Carnegiea gigantea]